MKKDFDKETPTYSSDEPTTPYQRARQEWDDRIGNARIQSRNWRFMALLSMVMAILLLIMLIISLSLSQDRVFIAQVTKGGRVVNIVPLKKQYHPTQAQEEYFIGQFIRLVRSIPLDPVVAKHNWMNAYQFLTRRASSQLNKYFQTDSPIKLLGKQTVTVKITDINAVSDKTYHVDWQETAVDSNGQQIGQQNYSGVFTIMVKAPTTQKTILQNPLGIFIVDFHISSREKAS